MTDDFFHEAFINPLHRLRMTHYPAVKSDPENVFGIAPHVDTSYCTILAHGDRSMDDRVVGVVSESEIIRKDESVL